MEEESEMTREEAIERLRSWQGDQDKEAAHSDADRVLCELLTALGYADVVAEWQKIDKWYA